MNRTITLSALLSATLFLLPQQASAVSFPPPVESQADLWNWDSGNFQAFTRSSEKFGPADRVFGHHNQPPAGFPDFGFADNLPQGTVNEITWSLVSPITLRSFSLYAIHDANKNGRGFRVFSLYANDLNNSGMETLLYQYDSGPGLSYGQSPDNLITAFPSRLHIADNVAPTLAREFRATWTQFGPPTSNNSGTRVMELDGYDTFLVPEPSTILLAGLGLSTVCVRRRRLR